MTIERSRIVKECANVILASHVRDAYLDFLADCVFESGNVSGVTCAGLDTLARKLGLDSLPNALKVLDEEGLTPEERKERHRGCYGV